MSALTPSKLICFKDFRAEIREKEAEAEKGRFFRVPGLGFRALGPGRLS